MKATNGQIIYEIGDRPTLAEEKALGVKRTCFVPSCGITPHNVKAVATGEKRSPKKGEWFLSGGSMSGSATAYRAPNDLAPSVYHIASLVKVRTEQIVVIEE
jgi:hypothetical protein